MKVAAYARVSTHFEQQDSSIENQKAMFNAFVKEKEWELIKVYIDRKTGTKAKRPKLIELIKDIERKTVDVVIFKDLSRLARNAELSYKVSNLARDNGVHIISLDGMVNTIEEPNGTYLGLMAWIYEKESHNISNRIKKTKEVRAKIGVYQGSTPPLGYEVEKGTLVIRNDDTPQIVHRIFNDYIKGVGVDTIAKNLTLESIPTPAQINKKKNAGSRWYGSTIKKILENPNYTGDLVQRKTETVSVISTKRKHNTKDNQIIIKNTHEPLISECDFNLVQELIHKRKTVKAAPKKNTFTNIAFCADCGKGMWYRPDRTGYICGSYGRYGKKVCAAHYIKEQHLIQQLSSDFNKFLKSINTTSFNKTVEYKISKSLGGVNREIDNADVAVRAIHNRKVKYAQMLADESIEFDVDTYNTIIKKDNKELEILESKLVSLKTMQKKNEFDLGCVKDDFRDYLFSTDVIKEMLHRFVTKIAIKVDGTPIIYYNFRNPSKKKIS